MTEPTPSPDGARDPLDVALTSLLRIQQEDPTRDALRAAVAAYARAAWQRGVPLKVVTGELREAFDAHPVPRVRSLHMTQRERLVTLLVAAYSTFANPRKP